MEEIITRTTYLLFIYLLVALFIERLIEILMAAFNYFDFRTKGFEFWNNKAHQWRKRLDRLYDYQGNQLRAKTLLDWLMWKILVPKPYPGAKSAISAKGVKLMYVRVGSRITAFLISLILVLSVYRYLNIDLLELLTQVATSDGASESGSTGEVAGRVVMAAPIWLRVLISSIILSAGVEPLHALIIRVEDIGKRNKPTNNKS